MKLRVFDVVLLAGLAVCASALRAQSAPAAEKILVGANKTYLLDAPVDINTVSTASPEVAEVVVANMRTVMINGKLPGETSVVLWLSDGSRREYDVRVSYGAARMEAAKLQIQKEFGGTVELTGDATAVYLTGSVKDMFASERATAIGATLGKVVNLLKVQIPAQEQQILLKVKFADVDRSKSLNLGANVLGTPGGYPFNVTTATNSPSRFTSLAPPTSTLSDALNILMFDPHANILATIQALQATNTLQILAEPNLLAMNGRLATFVAGGEFPYPTLQGGGSGVGQVTIQFREFGIKLKFTPTLTPRGTIRLHVAPEVSSLDYADALSIDGGTIPALTTRKVETEVELADGQSFAIAGLLDRQTTETLSKIPGLADIPILGKFFTSKSISRSNSELVVIITPELVSPIPKDQAAPDIKMPLTSLQGPGLATTAPRTPGTDQTGPLPARAVRSEIPVQEMEKIQSDEQAQAMLNGSGSSGAGSGTAGAAAQPTGSVPSIHHADNSGRAGAEPMTMSPLSAALVVSDNTLRDEALGCINNLPVQVACDQRTLEDVEDLLDRIERFRVDVVLLEWSLLRIPLDEFARRLKLTASEPVIFILQVKAVPEIILAAMQAGAQEYLCPPLGTPLKTAFERLAQVRAEQVSIQQKKLGRIFGFLSAKGGCGATTFASHAATIGAGQTDKALLLADLDFEAGLLRFILKAKPRYTLRDALDNMHRMDSSYWNALVSKHGGRLEFIAAPEELSERALPDPKQLGRLLRFIRTIYPVAVLDFGRCHNGAALDTLPELEALFLIVTEDLHVLENARDFIRMAGEQGKGPDRIQVLLNKVPARQKPDLDRLESFLGARPEGVYSDDTEALYETWSEGRMLGSDSVLGRQFTTLAKSMINPDAEKAAARQARARKSGSETNPAAPPVIAPGIGLGRLFSFMRSSRA